MTTRNIAAIVLAAGRGKRMKSALPKVMHPLAGRPMIAHLMASLERVPVDRTVVVVGPGAEMDTVAEAVAPAGTAVQGEPLGTGHAALAAREILAGFDGPVLILFGGALALNEWSRGLVETRQESLGVQAELLSNVLGELGITRGEPSPELDPIAAARWLRDNFVPSGQRVRLYDINGLLVADSYTVTEAIPGEPLAPADWNALERVTAAAFGQRRKMLRTSLRRLDVDTNALLRRAEVSPTVRAETVDIAGFCALAREYACMIGKERLLALS